MSKVAETQTQAPAATRTRILKTAERLFAEHGFDTVSLRHITTEAEVNLASVNYHFGSKEALVHEVIANRIGPINDERLRILSAAEETQRGALPIETVIGAFVDPVVEAIEESAHSDAILGRLIARILGEHDERFQEIFVDQFPEIVSRFTGALSAALPSFPHAVLTFRLLFTAGALCQALLYHDLVGKFIEGAPKTDLATVRDQMIPYMTAGMSAPAPTA